MKKKGKSSFHVKSCEVEFVEMTVINWTDNQPAIVLKTFEFAEPLTKAKRWGRNIREI